jgi:phosphatidylglycerophosphatase A
LGAGFAPIASGTAGSAVGVLLFLPVAPPGRLSALLILIAAVTAAGTWAAGICGRLYGKADDGRIVIDEIAGMLVTLISFPATGFWLLAGFLVFRLFDIWKPFPIRTIDQKWKHAGGVMADDLLAGVYANITLQILRAVL